MSKALKLLVLGGGGYWAYVNGYLDEPLAILKDALGGATAQAGETLPASPKVDPTPAVAQAPSSPETGLSKEELFLIQNKLNVSDWAWSNRKWTAALLYQESGGLSAKLGPVINVGANKGDRAHGYFQVMPKTAQWMYNDLGYRKYSASKSSLLTDAATVYFGTGYLQWLSDTYKKDRIWITHAYNGGPGWVNLKPGGASYAQNQKYVQLIQKRYNFLTQGVAT